MSAASSPVITHAATRIGSRLPVRYRGRLVMWLSLVTAAAGRWRARPGIAVSFHGTNLDAALDAAAARQGLRARDRSGKDIIDLLVAQQGR